MADLSGLLRLLRRAVFACMVALFATGTVLACESNEIEVDDACEACTPCSPTNASCELSVVDNTCTYTTTCDTGYGNIQNGDAYNVSCVLENTVTYSCGDGTGTLPNSTTAYNGAIFVPANGGVCTKSGKIFSGWLVSGTPDVITGQTTWNYETDKTLTAQYVDEKFAITTTPLEANTGFKFQLSAAGMFYIDWGDGTTSILNRHNDVNHNQYSHTYADAGTYTIRFGSAPTGYRSENVRYVASTFPGVIWGYNLPSTIRFYPMIMGQASSLPGTPELIASLSGSLGALFPTLSSASVGSTQPIFNSSFAGAVNLTTVPYNLFSGLSGNITSNMFSSAFSGASNLDTFVLADGTTTVDYIPPEFFGSITGTATNCMSSVFYGANKIATTCPSGTLQYITGWESSWNNHVSCKEATLPVVLYRNYDSNDVTPVADILVAQNSQMPSKDTSDNNLVVPTKTGYIFTGYYSAPTDGTKYYNADLTTANVWDSSSGGGIIRTLVGMSCVCCNKCNMYI